MSEARPLPLISLHRYVDGLDEAAIITFRAFTEEKQRKLKAMMERATDPLRLEAAYRKNKPLIFKPEAVSINHKTNEVIFSTKAGRLATVLDDDLLELLIELEGTAFYAKASIVQKKAGKFSTTYYVDSLQIFRADKDKERAKELLEEHNALDLLCYALGYKPMPEVKAVLIPKLLSLFKPYGKAIHVVQFTSPRLGKTESAKLLAELGNGYYCGVLPKRTKLIYNAQTGSYGLAYYYDALYIDEFDKLAGQRLQDFRESYEILLSGMDNGLWQRESTSTKAADFKRFVGLTFLGNLKNHELKAYTAENYGLSAREKLSKLLEGYGIEYPEPFIQRIAYTEFLAVNWQIYEALNYGEDNRIQYLDPAVARGLIEILREEAKRIAPARRVKNQYDLHFNALHAVLKVLGIEIEEADLESLIAGEITFWDLFTSQEFGRDSGGQGEAEKVSKGAEGDSEGDFVDMLDYRPSEDFLMSMLEEDEAEDSGAELEGQEITVEITAEVDTEITGLNGEPISIFKGAVLTLPELIARPLVANGIARIVKGADIHGKEQAEAAIA
ncbi:hypothetical protein [Geoglobus sp.]